MYKISATLLIIFLLYLAGTIYSYTSFIKNNEIHVQNTALMTARENVRKDIILRRWISSVDGLYISEKYVKPNPYLPVLKRDVITNFGDNLTLVNPAYTLRLLSEFEKEVTGWKATRITSLKQINPINKPYSWEIEALKSFESGDEEYYKIVNEDNITQFRYMIPLVTYKECLKCHGEEGYKLGGFGYKEGEVRGGISVTLNYTPFMNIYKELNDIALRNHLLFGSIGGIFLFILSFVIFSKHRELLNEKEKFKVAFNEAPVGILIFDKDGNILELNNKLFNIAGADIDSVKSLNLFNLPDKELSSQITSTFEKGEGYYENWYKTIDNKKSYLKCNFKLLPASKGIAVIEDLTENKIAEEEKIKVQEQLYQAQKMESIGVISGGIAHDFNNILTVIMTYCQIINSKMLDNFEIKRYIDKIIEAVEKASALTSQLLLFSRRKVLYKTVANPNEMIQNFHRMLKRVIPEDISIQLNLEKTVKNIFIDPVQFEQILMNLVVNARDAIKDNGKIVIETKNVMVDKAYSKTHYEVAPGEYVLLMVSDTGCGIEKEHIHKIFDPFFTTKEVGKGTGMGLATVYSIVKQCGGFINVYSEPGFGTTFRIYFPTANHNTSSAADHNIFSEEKPESFKEKIITLFRKPNILFVDDEKEIGEGYLKLLLDKGFNVLYVNDPEDGINAVKNGKFVPELLVSDIVMPKINGIELKNIIKQYVPKVKTIFISGYPDEIIREKGLDTESMNLIRKPFKFEDLINKIYELYKIEEDSDDK